MKVLRIKDWDKHFETAYSRKIVGPLMRFPCPTKHDGMGYRKLMRKENGPAHYGIWILLVAVAAKSPKRGYLIDDQGPLGDADLSIKTDAPTGLITETIALLVDEIGWLEWVEIESIHSILPRPPNKVESSANVLAESGAEREGKEREGTGQNWKGSVPDPVSDPGDRGGQGEGRSVPSPTPGRKLNGASIFLTLTDEVVADTGRLRVWFLKQAKMKSRITTSDPENWRFCIAHAEMSRGKDSPMRYFAKLFGGGKFDEIPEKFLRRAAEIAREFPITNGVT